MHFGISCSQPPLTGLCTYCASNRTTDHKPANILHTAIPLAHSLNQMPETNHGEYPNPSFRLQLVGQPRLLLSRPLHSIVVSSESTYFASRLCSLHWRKSSEDIDEESNTQVTAEDTQSRKGVALYHEVIDEYLDENVFGDLYAADTVLQWLYTKNLRDYKDYAEGLCGVSLNSYWPCQASRSL